MLLSSLFNLIAGQLFAVGLRGCFETYSLLDVLNHCIAVSVLLVIVLLTMLYPKELGEAFDVIVVCDLLSRFGVTVYNSDD